MPFCTNCGKEIEEAGKCPFCGTEKENPVAVKEFNEKPFGESKEKSLIPWWIKVLLCICMLFISWGSVIGIVVGGIISTSRDEEWKSKGASILKLGVIMLVIKIVIYVLIIGIGFSWLVSLFRMIPYMV